MLRRTKAGPFTLNSAISLDKLQEAARARDIAQCVLPLTVGLDDIPALSVTPDEALALRQGKHTSGGPPQAGSDAGDWRAKRPSRWWKVPILASRSCGASISDYRKEADVDYC
jgi:tRNA U55 pseudouridine synthase TruB